MVQTQRLPFKASQQHVRLIMQRTRTRSRALKGAGHFVPQVPQDYNKLMKSRCTTEAH